VVISTALPRFMSPGDTIDVPVTLTNTTKNTLDIGIECVVTGPVKSVTIPNSLVGRKLSYSVAGPSVWLKPNAETRELFRFVATSVGEAKFVVKVIALKPQGVAS
nr:hypothetical protein [Tanacetum cinerariifolium]